MFELKFTLKQHTPIIHFQHDQAGATLRATEVKPKLDRFIIEKCGGKENMDKSWFNNFEKGSLDYKMRIDDKRTGISVPIVYEETKDGKLRPLFPLIFGNIDLEYKKKFFMFSGTIELKIVCKSEALKNTISDLIEHFFLLNNFGFRQTKGFGAFTLSDRDNLLKNTYSFTVKTKKALPVEEKYKELFNNIELLYKTLRSGINTSNFGGIYFKSMMFMYAKSNPFNEQWDKRTIREKLYSSHETYKSVKGRRTDTNGTVHYSALNKNNILFRDLLGLSTEQDWMNYGKEKKGKDGKPIIKNGQKVFSTDTLSKESENIKIDRFGSPILFKPIKINEETFKVYIVANTIPNGFLNQSFRIKSKTYPGNNFIAKTPNNFDTNDFLAFCFEECFRTDQDIQNHIQGKKSSREAQQLIRIYSELRNSK